MSRPPKKFYLNLDREGTCFHEAGHAVIGWSYETEFGDEGVSVASDHTGSSHMRLPTGASARKTAWGTYLWPIFVNKVEATCIVNLAGLVAQVHHAAHPTSAIWVEVPDNLPNAGAVILGLCDSASSAQSLEGAVMAITDTVQPAINGIRGALDTLKSVVDSICFWVPGC